MPHLIANATWNNSGTRITARHLVRWDNSSSSSLERRHLGAGSVVLTLPFDNAAYFNFGSYFHTGDVDVACGYVDERSRTGQQSVADLLSNAVAAGTTKWSNDPAEWRHSSITAPVYWYYSGGLGIAKAGRTALDSESAMSLVALHFTLPEDYRNLVAAGAVTLMARVLVKGIGAWVMPERHDSSIEPLAKIPTIESNPNYFGGTGSSAYNYRLLMENYPDALSVAVHAFAGSSISASSFSPAKCFNVYGTCPTHNTEIRYELRRLYASFAQKNGRYPTVAELRDKFYIDFEDARNAHWLGYYWHGDRSNDNAATRFAEQTWAMSNGGAMTSQAIYTGTGGSGWAVPYISNSKWLPHDDSMYLAKDFSFTPALCSAMAQQDGVWVIAHGLPLLARTSLATSSITHAESGASSLMPASAVTWENGPTLSSFTGSGNSQGRNYATVVQSIASCGVEVTLG